ncbi:GNAT family N-acetyltransferase [Fictibacillus sp. NRS-1165]|uniref:GNAT family N-acetyltransferase n=1 Tax=Fictibacillus sp. NRS-1165 TaxID=3144463 RepID=UPI003D1C5CBF
MLEWDKSGLEKASDELEIMNTNPFYNKLFYGTSKVTIEQVEEELKDLEGSPRTRYLIHTGGRNAAILEYLLHNPKDHKPWLGFLMVHSAFQKQGLAKEIYLVCEEEMKKNKKICLRLGVLSGNVPALSFWSKMGFEEIEVRESGGKLLHILEKSFIG